MGGIYMIEVRLGAGCWMLDAGNWMLGTGSWMLGELGTGCL